MKPANPRITRSDVVDVRSSYQIAAFLRESAFRAPLVSTFPSHAAVGIVREDKGGRLYNTAMAVMILEVYYRHMPLYGKRAVARDL